jgi:hypothetical protein
MENAKFKLLAKNHQIYFKEKYIEKKYCKYKTWLSKQSRLAGKNFYNDFDIFATAEKRYPTGKEINVFSDMLRSEHIPLNLFVPLRHDLKYCKDVFNEFLNEKISIINKNALIDGRENLKIEFAPSPKNTYLNDNTSFDAYIEYINNDGGLGLLGIEVKYTEREYPLKKGTKEEKEVNDPQSKYYEISTKSNLYKTNKGGYSKNPNKNILKNDIFRQIWRNQLLAESITFQTNSKFVHSSSLILYPSKNSHFADVGEKYISFLNKNDNKFILVTYEEYFLACYKHCPKNEKYKNWVDYLYTRYII